MKLTETELAEILEKHARWLRNASCGDRAVLSRADLSDAVLSDANLSRADLRHANLSGANLSRADLSGAVLRHANLSGANLRRAVLSRADLSGSCLEPGASPFDWATGAKCELRVVDSRILVLGSRTTNQPHMNGPNYKTGKLYRAPVFSRDPCTACHPGLYIAGGPDEQKTNRLLVAFWLDEAIIVEKCRVPRFRTVASKKAFHKLTSKQMDK